MKRKMIIVFVCIMAIALGIFIDKSADSDMEKEKNKMKVSKREKVYEDNRLEQLLTELEGNYEDESATEIEVDKNVESQGFTSLKYAAYIDGGFYVYNPLDYLVSFIDKKTCKMMPLCSKPDCFHDNMECDAYFLRLDAIFVYGEKLYIVADDVATSSKCLYEMNRDGSGITMIRSLFSIESKDLNIGIGYEMHKGCLYMIINFMYDDYNKKDDAIMYCFPLDSKERKEIFKLTEYHAGIGITNFDGDNIYINSTYYSEYDFTSEEIIKNYCYNIKTESITEIKIPDGHYLQACFDGKMSSDYNEMDEEYNFQKYEAYYSDLDGKNSKCIYSDKNFGMRGYCVDSSYRYFITEKKDKKYLMVVSHDGEKLYETEAKDYYMIWSDKEDVLLKSETTERYALYNIKSGKIREVWEK